MMEHAAATDVNLLASAAPDSNTSRLLHPYILEAPTGAQVAHAGVKRAAAEGVEELEAATSIACDKDGEDASDAAATAAELIKSTDSVVLAPTLAAVRCDSSSGDTHAAFAPPSATVAPPPSEPQQASKRRLTPEQAANARHRDAIIDRCKVGDAAGAFESYDAMLASGATVSAHVYNAVLNLCTRASGAAHADLLSKAVRVFKDMEGKGITPNEAAYTSMIRLAALAGDTASSRAFFDAMMSKGMPPRLRTYAPLLQLYARSGDCDAAVALYADMRARGVDPLQPEYASIITALGKCGKHEDVHAVLRRVMEQSAVGEYAVSALTHACTRYFTGQLDALGMSSGMEALHAVHGEEWAAAEAADASAAPAPAVAAAADADTQARVLLEHPCAARDAATWPWACARVKIDPTDGVCPYTQQRLRSLEVSPHEHEMLVQQVSALALKAPKQFDFFKDWLAKHGPFDVIVDAANVGFFNQNFSDGGLMYTQIEAVVRAFERLGKRVLIIISKRWLEPERFARTDARRPSGIKRRRDGGLAGGAALAAAAGSSSASTAPVASAAAAAAAVPLTADTAPVAVAEPPAAEDVTARNGASQASRRANRGVVYAGGSLASALAQEEAPRLSLPSGEAAAPVVPQLPALRDTALNWWGVLAMTATGPADSSSSDDDVSSSEEDMDTYVDSKEHDGEQRKGFRIAPSLHADARAAPAIIKRWTDNNIAFRVPPGGNDDWYWLYAALISQTRTSTVVVSNDLMRDHHFQMLAPLAFLRWRERHQVFFSFEFNSTHRRMQPVFQYPRVYSHRVQPADDGSSWHLPIAGSNDEWLVAKQRQLL